MPDAPALDALYRLLGHTAFAWFCALTLVCAVVWLALKLIGRIVERRDETLVEGNKTLEQIQVNMAVQTARQAEGVEAMRAVTANLDRIAVRLDQHDANEERRHAETQRRLLGGKP